MKLSELCPDSKAIAVTYITLMFKQRQVSLNRCSTSQVLYQNHSHNIKALHECTHQETAELPVATVKIFLKAIYDAGIVNVIEGDDPEIPGLKEDILSPHIECRSKLRADNSLAKLRKACDDALAQMMFYEKNGKAYIRDVLLPILSKDEKLPSSQKLNSFREEFNNNSDEKLQNGCWDGFRNLVKSIFGSLSHWFVSSSKSDVRNRIRRSMNP